MSTYRLDTIIRQRDEGLKEVVQHLAAGQIRDGLQLLGEQGRIKEIENREERFQAIAPKYALNPTSTLVVSPDNESRKELNAAIRTQLRETGALSPDKYTAQVLLNRQEITGEDRKLAGAYYVGDLIRYAKANRTLGVERGDYATVLHVDHEKNEVTIERQTDGQVLTYNPRRISGVQLYERETRELAIGERVQFTNPWKDKGISNREMGTVRYLDDSGNITVHMDKTNRNVSWNLNQMSHIDYGYAMTSYSAQGATVDRVLVQIDANDSRTRQLVDQTLAYVALSRPLYDAQLYTDDQEKLDPALNRTFTKPKALSPLEIRHYRQPEEQAVGISAA
jgi:ATP-dependent exoDNAse (exonuclease V) alpha subunit